MIRTVALLVGIAAVVAAAYAGSGIIAAPTAVVAAVIGVAGTAATVYAVDNAALLEETE